MDYRNSAFSPSNGDDAIYDNIDTVNNGSIDDTYGNGNGDTLYEESPSRVPPSAKCTASNRMSGNMTAGNVYATKAPGANMIYVADHTTDDRTETKVQKKRCKSIGKTIRIIITSLFTVAAFAVLVYLSVRQQSILRDIQETNDNRFKNIHETIKENYLTLHKKINKSFNDSRAYHKTLHKKIENSFQKIDKSFNDSRAYHTMDSRRRKNISIKIDEKANKILRHLGDERNCFHWYKKGAKMNGIYNIQLNSFTTIKVYCDQHTDGGGWMVFQRRVSGAVSFYKGWEEYKWGFGDLNKNFWLGNNYLHILTQKDSELRVDLANFNGNIIFAKYSNFSVGNETEKYKLHVSGYSGNAGDSLVGHNGYMFSTKDQDNDVYSSSCAQQYKGAWWYSACHNSNLNGIYYPSQSAVDQGLKWSSYNSYTMKSVELKIREKTT